jgi:phosphoribosylanthranilate isomerase
MSAQVKICGIRQPEHAVAAVQAGTDFLGLIFAPSRRQISVEQARGIVEAARAVAAEQQTPVGVVGVFVNEQAQLINAVVDALALDWVQLSGHEPITVAHEIRVPVVKAVRFDQHASELTWLDQLNADVTERYPLLVDAQVAGSYGGAGVTADWTAAAQLAQRWPVWLAGGLTPENVADAIQAVQPSVVDVSSGVETNGIKDVTKINAFIRAAKQANTLQTNETQRS